MNEQGTMTGRTFNGRYEIKDRIGLGGMAEVYRALDNVLGRTVAVKVMLPQYAADPDFTQRFRQEAAAAANLQSPYIVNVYDWGQDNGTYFIVMEFVRGSDLKTAINQRGAINQRKVAEIAAQVCQALTVAHNQDIIHRDIKPQNIMVQPDGNVKVMDFGIARAKNSMKQQTSSVLGTAHYISPEQAQGKELTSASDIYSLGIAMFEATTGELPFDGEEAVSVAMMQVTQEAPLPSDINPNIDPDLEDIILCALAKNPHERFATANDMRLALNDYLAGRPVNLGGGRSVGGGFAGAETRVLAPVNRGGGAVPVDATQAMPGLSGAGMRPANYNGAPAAPKKHINNNFQMEEPKKSKAPIIGGVIAALLVIAAAAFVFMGGLGGDGKEVPNVVGMTEAQAVEMIEAEGFQVGTIDKTHDENAEAGKVLSQDPDGGTTKPEGTKINLVISMGVNEVQLPDFSNMTIDQAQREASKYKLVLQPMEAEYSADVEVNKIIRTSPEAGATVAEGSTVKYVLSLGTETVSVPNVVGKSRNDAMATLQDAGFKVSIEEGYSDNIKAGIVMEQSPFGGKLETGETVRIHVSLGPEPKPDPDPKPENNNGGGNSGGSADNGGNNNGDANAAATSE